MDKTEGKDMISFLIHHVYRGNIREIISQKFVKNFLKIGGEIFDKT